MAAAPIKCDACDGSGSLPVQEPEPGCKIYPGRCTKCGGKGRVPSPSEHERGERPFAYHAALRNGCQSETRSRSQRVAN